MANNSLVFMSDIHIGSGQPSNWYQSDIHDPYMDAALNWITSPTPITTGSDTLDTKVQELVILGDLVDQWTYVPTEPLDNMAFDTIIKNNPNIFSQSSGALIKTIQTLGDNGIPTTYVNGNHDMNITIDDIGSLTKGLTHHIQQVDNEGKANPKVTQANLGQYYLPTFGPRTIYCTHGHIYSLVCAPDHKNPPAEYGNRPYSYFLTRTMALIMKQIMDKQKVANVALLPGSGNPLGFIDWKEGLILLALAAAEFEYCKYENKKIGLSSILNHSPLEAGLIGELAPVKEWSPYTIPGVTSGPTMDEVAATYENLALYDNKVLSLTYPSVPDIDSKYYGGIDQEPAPDRLTAAFVGSDILSKLIAFVSGIDKTLNAPIQVMGHTHIPKDTETGLSGKLDGMYINAGFNCPSKPDMDDGDKAPSFAVLQWDGTNYTSWVVEMKMINGKVELYLNPSLTQKLAGSGEKQPA